MTKKNNKRWYLIINVIAIVIIVFVFWIINLNIYDKYRQRLELVSDSSKYCYGIDWMTREESVITLKGWFFEVEKYRGNPVFTGEKDAEMMLALVPVEEAKIDNNISNAYFFENSSVNETRTDVNSYFQCEYDYSTCGFTASIDIDDLELSTSSYRLIIKPDARQKKAVITNVYITPAGISYTEPSQTPELVAYGTEFDKIIKEGVRLVSRPDVGCYVYQLGKKLYWIADENFAFCDEGLTNIQYQMNTTQFNKLPRERIEKNCLWSSIGDFFEKHEITSRLASGKYRVSVRDIPNDYSVTDVLTGYYKGEDWVWLAEFKLNYAMLL